MTNKHPQRQQPLVNWMTLQVKHQSAGSIRTASMISCSLYSKLCSFRPPTHLYNAVAPVFVLSLGSLLGSDSSSELLLGGVRSSVTMATPWSVFVSMPPSVAAVASSCVVEPAASPDVVVSLDSAATSASCCWGNNNDNNYISGTSNHTPYKYTQAQKSSNFLQQCIYIYSKLNKLLPQNLYRWQAYSLIYLHSTCKQFHTYSTPRGRYMGNVPGVCRNYQCFSMLHKNQTIYASEPISWHHQVAKPWLSSARNC